MKAHLKLIRIQSTPVTLCIMAAGYGVYTGTVIDENIIPMLAVGALGHWGFYSMNEYVDYEYDVLDGKDGKPLVSGDVSMKAAKWISANLISLSLISAFILFSQDAFIGYLMCAFLGWLYNMTSKTRNHAAILLALWGVFLVMTGYNYAGGY